MADDEPMVWFHWSPTTRRKRINHYGLLPRQWSTDQLWRPPYICLAERPSFAWGRSGATKREEQHESWDLWEVWLPEETNFEIVQSLDKSIDEVRVYERIYKRNIWYVGSRSR